MRYISGIVAFAGLMIAGGEHASLFTQIIATVGGTVLALGFGYVAFRPNQ
jgi:hypothetical protein